MLYLDHTFQKASFVSSAAMYIYTYIAVNNNKLKKLDLTDTSATLKIVQLLKVIETGRKCKAQWRLPLCKVDFAHHNYLWNFFTPFKV